MSPYPPIYVTAKYAHESPHRSVFAHKREFQGGVEPSTGLPVSFIVEPGDKGDSAKKIREEESVPEMVLSDEGREFGTVKKWIEEKGFGYIDRRKGGDLAKIADPGCEANMLGVGRSCGLHILAAVDPAQYDVHRPLSVTSRTPDVDRLGATHDTVRTIL